MFESEDRHQQWAESKFGLGEMNVFVIADASSAAEFQSGQGTAPCFHSLPSFSLVLGTAEHSIPFSSSISSQPLLASLALSFQF